MTDLSKAFRSRFKARSTQTGSAKRRPSGNRRFVWSFSSLENPPACGLFVPFGLPLPLTVVSPLTSSPQVLGVVRDCASYSEAVGVALRCAAGARMGGEG